MTSGTAMLEAFYEAAGQFVPTEQLAKLLRTRPERIAVEVAELEQLGYTIEAHPHFGYRLLGTPDRLTADDIRARLEAGGVLASGWTGLRACRNPSTQAGTPVPPKICETTSRIIGSEILVFEQTASTNDVVARMASTQPGEGLVVFAESQSKGRGRHGRVWVSPRGKGLWFSVLLRPNLPLSAAPRITVAASVAVARSIRKTTGLDARIKWPNDVTVNGKKVAGILVETIGSSAPIGGTGVPACVSSRQPVGAFTITRRNLPHWQNPGHVYFVTFRVRSGAVLTEPMRDIVLESCCHWHGHKYDLYAATVMPDHVHLLFWPRPVEPGSLQTLTNQKFHSLSEILHSIKSFTAHQIQRQSDWSGPLWMDESFDRIVRDDAEFAEKWNYIAQNAVKKGLSATTEDYRWFWCVAESPEIEPEERPQAGTPVPPNQPCIHPSIFLGIGIDVNCRREEFPPEVAELASSLEIESGRQQDRAELAAEVLGALDEYYAAAQKDFDTIIAEWARLSTTLGKQLVVTMGKRRIEGHAQALDEDGALLLRKDNGQIERILGGDVTVEK